MAEAPVEELPDNVTGYHRHIDLADPIFRKTRLTNGIAILVP